MSRRARVPPAVPACPCGRGAPYDGCCGLLHAGRSAATAELLMRSRYSAFARGDAAYLLRTWHPTTRPPGLELDPGQRWVGLEVLDVADGGLFAAEGTVGFRAHWRRPADSGVQSETSRFVREQGHWAYLGRA